MNVALVMAFSVLFANPSFGSNSLHHAAVQINVATFNAGMLGGVHGVPFLKEREAVVVREIQSLLQQKNIDVIAFQEAWTKNFLKILASVDDNYEVFVIEQSPWLPILENEVGLAYLVKKNLAGKVSFKPFSFLDSWVCGWGFICKRGLFTLSITKNSKMISLTTTHLTPLVYLTNHRSKEMLEIVNAMAQQSQLSSAAILLADFNISKKFGPLKKGDDGSVDSWAENGRLYDDFLKNLQGTGLNCVDTYEYSQKEYEFTQNREQNLTALVSPSAGTAPSQRNDMIFVCDQNSSWKVRRHSLIFDQVLESGAVRFHLSDHFGVFTSIEM